MIHTGIEHEFIENISKYIIDQAPKFDILVVSPIIAQACLESGYGTSDKAKYHNYFGLKYRKNRVTSNNGTFSSTSSEQNSDGSYTLVTVDWYSFDDMETGVIGYFQFININRYSNLKNITDPKEYIKRIRQDRYATSLSYVENITRIMDEYDLYQYDKELASKFKMGSKNSNLVDCIVKSPNHSGLRIHKIDRITPHCVVGQLSAESIGGCFINASREASCNYGIGKDGRVLLCVDEENRSWCSSSNENDQRAITIECASDKKYPYSFNFVVYNKLIDLCVDICIRNKISKLIWIEDKEQALSYELKDGECLLTVHRWFANKSCPGDWMFNRMDDLANAVNAYLLESDKDHEKPVEPEKEINTEKKKYYRVQIGAYSSEENAKKISEKAINAGYNTFIRYINNLYKVQVGAFSNLVNAEALANKLRNDGFYCYVSYTE